jgi:TetR/AcrR family transcriptional regulator, transcriptional repressor for nem operon
MARPRSWDEALVLRSAVKIFRERGYANVSVRELEAATGLHATSLYQAFGSKEGLFVAALASYNEKVTKKRIATHLEREDSPLDGIRSYFCSVFPSGTAADAGCLLTNTAIESYGLDASAHEGVATGLQLIEDALEAALVRAQARKQIKASVVPREVASQLLVLYQGVLVLVRFGTSKAELMQRVEQALDALVHPSQRREKHD